MTNPEKVPDPGAATFDAVVVGAGFAGLYMLHLLRDKLGLRATAVEAADGVGGTWYWNRYPGARCDIPSMDYSYSFSDELQQEWVWSEKYASQAEILAYLNFVAKKYDLKKDIRFSTRVTAADYDEAANCWRISTDSGENVTARFLISGVGALSTAAAPDIPGIEEFAGLSLQTSSWPREGVALSGKRVGIIGTGATAVQVIPIVAEDATHLTVFQRTPPFAAPLLNRPLGQEEQQEIKARYKQVRADSWDAFAGVPFYHVRPSAMADTPEQRREHYEHCWSEGGFSLWLGSYEDLLMDKAANDTAGAFVREKIRERVKDPKVAEKLVPPPELNYGTKRQPCETGYYETYNRDNVTLVDIKADPIREVTPAGIRTTEAEYPLDVIIYATGFDAFTGSLYRMNIRGRKGKRLQDHWSAGPRTHLGLMSAGFPNFFTITGPLSPSVLFNMPLSIEQHCEWIAGCIEHLRKNKLDTIEPTCESEDAWTAHVKEVADATLLPSAESWYMGANVPGKPRVFMVYLGGGKQYREICEDVVARGYAGFELAAASQVD
ncbi:MAG: NAD(P)/FAD-dependent oxidoreductase [Halieaceae bacterium]|jgi:cyclohexanone monooxygenase|nr:NAD(P)/FAD-dependent oxidoreductase [Halieaceae bacterium]